MPASRLSDVLQTLDEVIEPSNPFVLSSDVERLSDAIINLPKEHLKTIYEKPEEMRERVYKASLEDYLNETREKEEKSHSSYFMQKFDETIKRLSPKLREKVYKDYVEMMKKERDSLGWKKVHEELLSESRKQKCGGGRSRSDPTFCWLCEEERLFTESLLTEEEDEADRVLKEVDRMLYEADNMSDVDLLREEVFRLNSKTPLVSHPEID